MSVVRWKLWTGLGIVSFGIVALIGCLVLGSALVPGGQPAASDVAAASTLEDPEPAGQVSALTSESNEVDAPRTNDSAVGDRPDCATRGNASPVHSVAAGPVDEAPSTGGRGQDEATTEELSALSGCDDEEAGSVDEQAAAVSSEPRTFRLCGDPGDQDVATEDIEKEIEELVAGGSFSAVLKTVPGGCADLTITPNPSRSASGANVQAKSSMSVSVSSASGQDEPRRITVEITSQNGQTTAKIHSGEAAAQSERLDPLDELKRLRPELGELLEQL